MSREYIKSVPSGRAKPHAVGRTRDHNSTWRDQAKREKELYELTRKLNKLWRVQ